MNNPLSIPMKGLRLLRRTFGGGAGGATGFNASLGLFGATRGEVFTVLALAFWCREVRRNALAMRRISSLSRNPMTD
ncbi:hypothetical protein [Bosea sp. LC85]|uniref:hypothetical protein n=1 Tax=Bosea sp. LC85 TaxID=1502851 RepID=UPI001FCA68F5|nr:hypothetical protein [Bosea sp. LC85]